MAVMEKISWGRTSLCAAFIAVGFLLAFCLLGAIGPVNFGKDAPAWMQAVGSLIAIAVAIFVPWRQRQQQLLDSQRKERKDIEREAQLLSVMHGALFQPIEMLRGNSELVLTFVGHPLEVRSTLPEDIFDRAPEFDQFRSSLHLMGDTGIDVNVIISREDHLRLLLRVLRSHPTLESDFQEKARRALTKTQSMAVAILPKLRDRGLQKSNQHSAPAGA